MSLICVICSEFLSPSDDVCSTPCGHIFHYDCLSQWLERSRSCPQCRKKTTGHQFHRIYLSFTDETYSLLDRIDKLKYEVNLRDKENDRYAEDYGILEKQNMDLRKQVKKLENELYQADLVSRALLEHTNYYKIEAMCQKMKAEIECTFDNVLYQLRRLKL